MSDRPFGKEPANGSDGPIRARLPEEEPVRNGSAILEIRGVTKTRGWYRPNLLVLEFAIASL